MALKILFVVVLFLNHPQNRVIERIKSKPLNYPVKFAFVADSREPLSRIYSADSIFHIELNMIYRQNPDFIVHGGDFLIRGTPEEYEKFTRMIDSIPFPFLTVLGNHEIYHEKAPFLYDSIFGSPDYYFDYGKFRFIFVADCHQSPKVSPYTGYHYIDYYLSDSQLNWLESLLIDADTLNLIPIIFAHVPPCLEGIDTTRCLGWHGYYPKPNRKYSHVKRFLNLIKTHGVPLAIFSHKHFFRHYEKDGIHFLISGGGGAPLAREVPQNLKVGGNFYHFLFIKLYPDSIKVEVWPINKKTYDKRYSFQIQLNPSTSLSESLFPFNFLELKDLNLLRFFDKIIVKKAYKGVKK